MEIVSSYQLHNYEDILEQINSEHEKSEHLKKEIQRADDAITALKLSLSPCQMKISHVNVKIFSHFAEILNLYDCDVNCDTLTLSKCNNCNFFLIEVILTKCLLAKLVELEWKLQISIQSETFANNKVVALSNRFSILEVIPVSADIYDCVVKTTLFLCSEGDWNVIDLHCVDVDISYYFESSKEKIKDIWSESLLNISKLYNKDVDMGHIQLQNQIKCGGDKGKFVANIVKNSYHRLNLESFSDFVSDDKNVIDFQFSIRDKKVNMLYNKNLDILKIKCTCREMLLLKKFFIKNYCKYDHHHFKKKLKGIVEKKHSLEEADLNEMLLFYQQLRKLWL
ncbi:unnamed protein product [Tenebrio molitor]|nr:unnamed protein product [Tenebrio molitor]